MVQKEDTIPTQSIETQGQFTEMQGVPNPKTEIAASGQGYFPLKEPFQRDYLPPLLPAEDPSLAIPPEVPSTPALELPWSENLLFSETLPYTGSTRSDLPLFFDIRNVNEPLCAKPMLIETGTPLPMQPPDQHYVPNVSSADDLFVVGSNFGTEFHPPNGIIPIDVSQPGLFRPNAPFPPLGNVFPSNPPPSQSAASMINVPYRPARPAETLYDILPSPLSTCAPGCPCLVGTGEEKTDGQVRWEEFKIAMASRQQWASQQSRYSSMSAQADILPHDMLGSQRSNLTISQDQRCYMALNEIQRRGIDTPFIPLQNSPTAATDPTLLPTEVLSETETFAAYLNANWDNSQPGSESGS